MLFYESDENGKKRKISKPTIPVVKKSKVKAEQFGKLPVKTQVQMLKFVRKILLSESEVDLEQEILQCKNNYVYWIPTKNNKIASIAFLQFDYWKRFLEYPGYDDIHTQDTRVALIHSVCTSPLHRKKGCCSEILSNLLSFAKLTVNLHQIYLEVEQMNEEAIKLYKKYGFNQIFTNQESKFILMEVVWNNKDEK